MTRIRTYPELRRFKTFEERFRYLSLQGIVGAYSFGFDRWLNQRFYKSKSWKDARNQVIIRDDGCDLGVPGHEIYTDLLVHHMNPVSLTDIVHGEEWLLDPNYLITTSLQTHNAIHFGDERQLPRGPIERKAGDTKLW